MTHPDHTPVLLLQLRAAGLRGWCARAHRVYMAKSAWLKLKRLEENK